MREWRKTHRPTPEQRRKSLARSYANVYLNRGKIERKPCEECGEVKSQMHHADYRLPLDVKWLCRRCHAIEHGAANFRTDIGRHAEPLRKAA
jgi:ribosomal protein S27AE